MQDRLPIDSDSIAALQASQLARLLEAGEESPAWSAADAAAALRQQLTAPLLPDLANSPGAEPERLQLLIQSRSHTASFLDQLTSTEPAAELLESIKRWARHMRGDPCSPLSGGPATVLYYAAIAAALVRLGMRITTLNDADLQQGFTWGSTQEGAQTLTALFREAMKWIEHPSRDHQGAMDPQTLPTDT